MGAFSGGRCFADALAAARSECSSYPRSAASADGVVSWSCDGSSSDGSALLLVKRDTAGVHVSQSLAVSYPPCDPLESYTDAAALWGAGLLVCVAIYGMKAFVMRLLENQ